MRDVWTVIRFTFMNRFRTRTYLVTTLIFVILLSILVNLPFFIQSISNTEDKPERIGILAEDGDLAERLSLYFAKQDEPLIETVLIEEGDETQARALMEEDDITGYLMLYDPVFAEVQYKSENELGMGIENALKQALSFLKQESLLADLGLTEAELQRINAPISIETVQISLSDDHPEQGKSEGEMMTAFVLVYIMLFLLYMGVVGYGNMVATEITSEKSSRVMELLITSVTPLKQMFGKIVGICLLGFLQMAIFLAAILVNAAFEHNRIMLNQLEIDLFASGPGLFIYFVIFYILGYLIYASVFAGIGSLVSRTEEVGQAIMPVMMLVIAAFMVAMFGLQSPNAPFVTAMSFVPFFSPLLMFLRIGMSDPAGWEIALSLIILLGSVIGLAWLSAKIYRTGVLMYGKRPSFKELRRAMKANRS